MRNILIRTTLLLASVCLCLLSLESALRVRSWWLLSDAVAPAPSGPGRTRPDPVLGWTTRSGRVDTGWVSNIEVSGFRSNGQPAPADGSSILTVGDSFTFGDEVNDNETWVARLEALIKRRVHNAGVPAYGLDQTVLRAERLVEQYKPALVIVSFISHDIDRSEYSFYGRWKPYFELKNGTLMLQPLAANEPPLRRFEAVRTVLRSHSFLADSVFSRIAPRWWAEYTPPRIVHHNGEAVSASLLARLDDLQRRQGRHLLAVALGTNGVIGDNRRLEGVITRAREKGVVVLELASIKPELGAGESLYRPGGHYSPAMNQWVAAQIAAFLDETGLVRN